MITIRPIEQSDINVFTKWWQDSELINNGQIENILKNQTEAYFNDKSSSDESMQFVICLEADPIGYISINRQLDHWWKLQIFIVDSHLLGKGFGPEAIKLLVEKAASRGISKIYADIDLNDGRAIRAFQKAGFYQGGIEQGSVSRASNSQTRMIFGT